MFANVPQWIAPRTFLLRTSEVWSVEVFAEQVILKSACLSSGHTYPLKHPHCHINPWAQQTHKDGLHIHCTDSSPTTFSLYIRCFCHLGARCVMWGICYSEDFCAVRLLINSPQLTHGEGGWELNFKKQRDSMSSEKKVKKHISHGFLTPLILSASYN